jgi:hypothetical protein
VRREAQHRLIDTIPSIADIPVPANYQPIALFQTLCVTAWQHQGGLAEHNPFVLPPNGSASTAMNLAAKFRREVAFSFCAERAGVDPEDPLAVARFNSVFPSQHGAFIAGKDKGKPTGILIVQISPEVAREFATFLTAHHLGFIATIDQGEFATAYNKALVIERKINGIDVW